MEHRELMKLADAYADASFDQGLNQRTEDPKPEKAREKLVTAITAATQSPQGVAGELLAELIICRNDLARQAAELRQSVTVPGTETILDEEDETLCEFEESRIARLDALIARAQVA